MRGLLIGLAIAAPVGPIGVLCIRGTLAHGRLHGLVIGLGAATADGLYGAVAAFGLTAVSELLLAHAAWLRLLGGVFLCGLGVRIFAAVPASAPAAGDRPAHLAAWASTVLLTLANPATLLSFAAIFAGLGLVGPAAGWSAAALLVGGVFGGSALWWLGLSAAAGRFHRRVAPRGLRWVNRLSGAIILALGLAALAAGLGAVS